MTATPDLAAFVERHLARWFGCVGAITDATELDVAPDARHAAFTALVAGGPGTESVRQVVVVDLASRDVRMLTFGEGSGEGFGARWAPESERLAWIAQRGDRTTVAIAAAQRLDEAITVELPGTIEYLCWSPDGTRVLIGVAEAGAARSDVHGSGRVPSPDEGDGSPRVSGLEADAGRRRLWVVDPKSGSSTRVPVNVNVWDAAWAGPAAVIAVVSDGSGESDWYGATLAEIEVGTGLRTALAAPDGQLARPAASPSGERRSALVGLMSDRGLDGGDLIVFTGPAADYRVVPTDGVTVTDHHWLDEDRLIFAGLRGVDTVVGTHDLSQGSTTVQWSGRDGITSGDLVPQVSVGPAAVYAIVHGHDKPPTLAELRPDSPVDVLELAPGRERRNGKHEVVEWTAPDGETIQGLLTYPDTPGPHPLVVHVHGGPVWAWRPTWSMHYPYTNLLVERGYAVLHPNGRGSLGRGQEFVRAGLHDMGGADALDLIAGVDALAAAGRIDPDRVGVTGNSYGGFMAAWLAATSDRFAAAVARSPVTDWVSQHHTSNIPGFDRACLRGDPLAATSDYRTRSPFYLADQVHTPMLLMAGAQDLATPAEQAAMFHRALVERGRDSTLVIYPDEGHGVRHHAALVDQCTRILAFFEQHLKHRPARI